MQFVLTAACEPRCETCTATGLDLASVIKLGELLKRSPHMEQLFLQGTVQAALCTAAVYAIHDMVLTNECTVLQETTLGTMPPLLLLKLSKAASSCTCWICLVSYTLQNSTVTVRCRQWHDCSCLHELCCTACRQQHQP